MAEQGQPAAPKAGPIVPVAKAAAKAAPAIAEGRAGAGAEPANPGDAPGGGGGPPGAPVPAPAGPAVGGPPPGAPAPVAVPPAAPVPPGLVVPVVLGPLVPRTNQPTTPPVYTMRFGVRVFFAMLRVHLSLITLKVLSNVKSSQLIDQLGLLAIYRGLTALNIRFRMALASHLFHLINYFEPGPFLQYPQAIRSRLNIYNDIQLDEYACQIMGMIAQVTLNTTNFPGYYRIMFHSAYANFPADEQFTRTDAAGNEVGDMEAIAQFLYRGGTAAVPAANLGALADPTIDYPGFFGTAAFNLTPAQVTIEGQLMEGLLTTNNIMKFEKPPIRSYNTQRRYRH